MIESLVDEVPNDLANEGSLVVDSNDVALINHDLLELLLLGGPVVLELVDLAELSDDLEELISSACLLWLEEGQPEDLSVDVRLEGTADVSGQVVVDDVLEVN